MKSPACGFENKPSKKICRKCGASISASSEPSRKIEENEELYKRIAGEIRKIFLSLSAAVLITLVIYFILRFYHLL